MNYYYFDVLSTDIVSTTFNVIPYPPEPDKPTGDVNIVLRRALPVVDLFPRPTFFDYESTQPAFGSEMIIVNSNSLPVKLTPGRWYLGVYNTTNAPAYYDIVATSSTAPLWNYVDLADSTPTNFTVFSFDPRTNFFRFVVDGTNKGVLFEIYGLGGDADLLVRRSDLPAPDLYDFSYLQGFDFNTFTFLDELVALRTNIFIPQINATNWFLQIVNGDKNGGIVNGTVCAKVTDAAGLLFDCSPMMLAVTNFFIPGGPFVFAFNSVPGEKYLVEQTSNFRAWSTNKIVTASGAKTTVTAPAPHAGPPVFYRIKQVK
jgi:hypothetical protein